MVYSKRVLCLALLYTGTALVSSCSSNGPELLEDDLTLKQESYNQVIGVNPKGEVVVETKTTAEAELVLQELANERLLESVQNRSATFENCRMSLAHPDLGGAGKIGSTPDIAALQPLKETIENFGVDSNGHLIWKKTADYREQLNKARHFHATLSRIHSDIEKQIKVCEFELKMALARK